jgi:heme-degrading monooxygenase HmoA
MYARLQTTRTIPTTLKVPGIENQPGFAGLYMLEQIGTGWGTMLTLWQTREDAVLASKNSEEARHSDDVYEVEDDWSGMAAGEPAQVANAVYFDGPLSPARVAAARRGLQERIRPALAQVPGLVRGVFLWHPDEAKAVTISLAVSVEALEAAGRAVNSTELLPGEDPALLTGPDRIETHRVVAS